MSNLYFGITRYRYDICSEISDMACFSLNLKTAVDFNAEARCASNEVVWLPERSEPEEPQGDARRKVTQRDPAKSKYSPSAKSILALGEVRTAPLNCPYRTIHLGIQGKCLESTGKVLREYRRNA